MDLGFRKGTTLGPGSPRTGESRLSERGRPWDGAWARGAWGSKTGAEFGHGTGHGTGAGNGGGSDPTTVYSSAGAPMYPSFSRKRMIFCAAASALRVVVSMVTSAFSGASYGSSIPVNSLMSPARALA